tara:strand:+ start:6368 stop:6592 length:225 start_codon:yes stop_codon:yes gene_type:complete
MMNLKDQIKAEIKIMLSKKGVRHTYKSIAESSGMTYNGLSKWLKDDKSRGIGSDKLESLAKVMGKRFVMVDKDL